MSDKQRLDNLLVERGLAESRSFGRRLIMAGEVLVNRQPVTKPGTQVRRDALVEVRARPRFVSRGGEKLAAALEAFALDVTGWTCADVGASTGGFTDCLLQTGVARVYAIDVGYGQLAWSLRQDPRVVVMERTNARHVESLPEPVHLTTIDASFISLRVLLPVVRGWLGVDGQIVALVKPQFEAGRRDVGKGGVVRERSVHRRVLEDVLAAATRDGYTPRGLIPSPLRGPAGNVEFLLWLASGPVTAAAPDTTSLIDACFVRLDQEHPGEH
jgi:23S rRNA (cytidine1920-2'-O)/16S rRNA (cytidine1409-2'-O)-methyltransferase